MKFKVGDICIFKRDNVVGTFGIGDEHIGRKCRVDGLPTGGFDTSYKISLDGKSFKVIFFCKEGNLELFDEEKQKEREREREELKDKIKDIDPYGEEDWLDENKVNESIDDEDLKIGDICIFKKDSICGTAGISEERIGQRCVIINIVFNYKNTKSNAYHIQFLKNNTRHPFVVSVRNLELDKEYTEKFKDIELKMKDIDPYGEEDWLDENKVNELFDTEKTYPYEFFKKRSWMKPFVDYIYRFKSKDDIVYYVTISYNKYLYTASVKFTDEEHYKGLINKIKDSYVNMEKHDAINVLNTVFKICKDYYEKNKDEIKEVTTNTLDQKRLSVYKYLFGKYFKGWNLNSYTDARGEYVIECKPIKITEKVINFKNYINESHEDIDPYGEEDWNEFEKNLEKEIIKYFIALFGDKVTLTKVASWPDLKWFCEFNVIDRSFVILTMKKYLNGEISLNESHEDIDPFGEEDWEYEDEEFEIGDKIICRNIDNCLGLTLGKIYIVKDIMIDYNPRIINDYNTKVTYLKNRFKKIK